METKQQTIYVVDDSSVTLTALEGELLRNTSCRIKVFSSAEECIQYMENALPDLVISDYNLDPLGEKKMNGDQMLAQIKMRYPAIPVLMYSSQKKADMIRQLMRLGANGFIPKEKYSLQAISETVHRQLGKLRHDAEMRSIARTLTIIFILFIASASAVYIYASELLPYLVVGVPLLILLCFLGFSLNRKPVSKMQVENVRQRA